MHIIEYLKGLRKGAAANRLEREAMQDPFLSEALAGYEKHRDDHAVAILRIQQQLKKQHRNNKRVVVWLAAACVIALLGLSTFLFMHAPVDDTIIPNRLAILTDTLATTTGMAQVDTTDSVVPSKTQEKPVLADKFILRKKTPKKVVIEEKNVMPLSDSLLREELFTEQLKIIFVEVVSGEPTKKELPQMNMAQTLEGKVAGLAVIPSNITIRGTSTLETGNSPLYVVDGVPVSTDYFSSINADDIESLNILKDASAKVIYGARGANGVILVTTKKAMNEVLPEPLIGKKAYKKYILENLQQPTDFLCATEKGRIVLTFYVDTKGTPYNIEIQKSLCKSCDEEAIRLIEEGGKWTAGKKQVRYVIRFRGAK